MLLSDNNAGVHPQVLQSIVDANVGHTDSYGYDKWTAKAEELIRSLFHKEVEVYFVTNGTAANVVALSGMIASYEGVCCPATAHINNEECGAFEKFTASKLIPVPGTDGKLTQEDLKAAILTNGDEHFVQVKVAAIAQVTELGTVYSAEEISALSQTCRKHDLYLFLDGARISNALAKEKKTLSEMVEETGVDVMTFGGTKNGLMFGEAIVVLNPELFGRYRYLRKQSMQLLSKMRFLSAQFIPYVADEIYLKNARHANEMAEYLKEKLMTSGLSPVNKEHANILFYRMEDALFESLASRFSMHYEIVAGERWTRLVTAWDTTREEIDDFANNIKEYKERTDMVTQLNSPKAGDLIARLHTSRGTIAFRLFPEVAPKAVKNFTELAEKGYYDGIIFHRVIPKFMIQTGDPTGTGRGGESIYGKAFEDEFHPLYRNFQGAVSMANAGPGTNGSQFFIVESSTISEDILQQMNEAGEAKGYPDAVVEGYREKGGCYWLDFKHTVFGQVFEGMDVVHEIANVETGRDDKPVEEISILSVDVEEYQ